MDITWEVFGHQKAKKLLTKQLSLGALPHAYLFAGPEGVGKKLLAMELAKKVLNTERLENHADFQLLDISGEITMEPLLEFIGRLRLKPFLGEKKVAVINNAENLNIQAQNALLKTLEEPTQSTVIILIAASVGLLPTIVSRCQLLSFGAFGQQELLNFAQVNNFKINEEIINLSFGRSSRLKKLVEDENFYELQSQSIHTYQRMSKMPLAEKLACLPLLADQETFELEKNLTTWLFWQAGQLKQYPETFVKIQALIDAISGLKRNFNKKLVLQGLVMKI